MRSTGESLIPVALAEAIAAGSDAETIRVLNDLRASGQACSSAQIGEIYELGLIGVRVDVRKAMDWYTRGTTIDDDAASYFALARLHFAGAPGVKNTPLAIEFFKQAAARGSIEAATLLGFLSCKGFWVDKDVRAAADHLEIGVRNGYILALYLMAGLELRRGHVLRAARLFWRSLTQGNQLLTHSPDSPRLYGVSPRFAIDKPGIPLRSNSPG